MGLEARTPSDLPGKDRTTGANPEEDSALAGCMEIALSEDSLDRERTGREGVVGDERSAEGGETEVDAAAEAGRLRGFLQDLVERESRARVAERLGVSERTLRRALASPGLTPKMTRAVQRELDVGEAQAESEWQAPAGLDKQLRRLERRLAALERSADAQLEELWEAGDDLEHIRAAVAPRVPGGAGTAGDSGFTGLVAVDPESNDAAFYGEALPVVAEWRRALRALDEPPHTLAWLAATERLLRLEIQLIDDRQLTLPPADAPWDGVRRENELQLRQDRLRELRRQRLWTEPLHWTARLLTLGRWGRGVSLERQMQREFEARRAELISARSVRRLAEVKR